MAINRNAYKSLVESVQQAVAPQNLVEWPLTIAGQVANNAMELAQILNSMSGGGKQQAPAPSVSTGVVGAMRSKGNMLASTKKGGGKTSSKPSKPTAKGAGASVGTASIAEANRPYIPSNLSGAALSQYLNNLQNQGGANVGTEVGTAGKINRNPLSSTRKGNPSKPSAPKPPKPAAKGVGTSMGAASIAEDGEWDILDEILAEGLELYGEDGLAEILADFAETGEMSQELADLLSDE